MEDLKTFVQSQKCPVCGKSADVVYNEDNRGAYKNIVVSTCKCDMGFPQRIADSIRQENYNIVNQINFQHLHRK